MKPLVKTFIIKLFARINVFKENTATLYRSSHQRCSVQKSVLRNLTKFTGKHLCQSLFFNKVTTLLKRRLWHRCFPVNFVKFLITSFSRTTSGGLLLPLVWFSLFKIYKVLLIWESCLYLYNFCIKTQDFWARYLKKVTPLEFSESVTEVSFSF